MAVSIRCRVHASTLVALVVLSPWCSASKDGLFEAFPHLDDRQLAVYEANILQLVGTASMSSVLAALLSARDSRFKPLTIGDGKRALLSVGIADFRNTSAGPYRELVVAFPACQTEEPPVLDCGSFVRCQSQLPDCAHTYMFRSFVSQEAALWVVRSFGVDAQLASTFDFKRSGGNIDFNVLGPGGSEVLQGTVEVSVPGAANVLMNHNGGGGESDPASKANVRKLSRDGYNLHPYVGIPGVLGPGQSRYACAFSAKVAIEAARSGPLMAGPLLEELDFQPEGVLHLPDVSVMQLPPWGHGGSPGPSPSNRPSGHGPSLSPSGTLPADFGKEIDPRTDGLRKFFGMPTSEDVAAENGVEMVEEQEAPRAPWTKAASKGANAARPQDALASHQDAFASPSQPAKASAARRAQASSRPAPARAAGSSGLGGLGALGLSEL